MDAFSQLIEALSAYGLPGLAAGLAVLLGVFAAKRGGLVISGTAARIANLILSVVVSGLDPTNPEAGAALTAAIAALSSAIAFKLLEYINSKTVKMQFGK